MKYSFLIIVILEFASCKSLNEIEKLPKGQYYISSKDTKKIDTSYQSKKELKIFAKGKDSAILFYIDKPKKNVSVNLFAHDELLLRQRLIDIDIFTIPFKIRLSVNDFPPQLNPNFSAAIYLGRRHNYYKFTNADKEDVKLFTRGIGYGIFAGLGAVTMKSVCN